MILLGYYDVLYCILTQIRYFTYLLAEDYIVIQIPNKIINKTSALYVWSTNGVRSVSETMSKKTTHLCFF